MDIKSLISILCFGLACSTKPQISLEPTKTPSEFVSLSEEENDNIVGEEIKDEPIIEEPSSIPEGFGEEDRFDNITNACLTLTSELAPKKFQRQVYNWCEHRAWASTRYTIVKSKVDGSQVHDRDRFVAWKFYAEGIRRGTIDPVNCKYHRLDTSIKHNKTERHWLRKGNGEFPNWPFGSPKMSEKKRDQWLNHPHDMERFTSRGPHDNHLSLAAVYIPGCWAPEAMDRYDVAATITIKRAISICENHGCRTKKDIKKHW